MEQILPSSDVEALRGFVYNNEDLERLEDIIDDFNVFSALDIVQSEARHSTFLAWLLNPDASHGLGDYFLSSFLKDVVSRPSRSAENELSIFDIDSWKFDNAEVLTEWRNIDIVIRSDVHKFICIVENKVQSKEHGDQLQRYRNTIESEYPNYRQLCVFLTVEGDIPSDKKYAPYTYSDLVKLIEGLVKTGHDKVGAEIISFISHYAEMLRRYIVENSEIQEICGNIYKKHKKALDLIFEYRPDKRAEISECIVDIVDHDSDLILDYSSKSYIRFIPKELDHPRLKKGEGWTDTGRMLLFELHNYDRGVHLNLLIGPGPQAIREELYSIANANRPIFKTAKGKLTPQWKQLYTEQWLSAKQAADMDMEDIGTLLTDKLGQFKANVMPMMIEKLQSFAGATP